MKIQKTYLFDSDVIQHANNNPQIKSFAKWACKSYRAKFMSLENLTKELDHHINMVDECKKQIKQLKNIEQDTIGQLSNIEIQWIKKEIPWRIKKGVSMEGAYNLYKNTISTTNINRRQFRLLIKSLTGMEFYK